MSHIEAPQEAELPLNTSWGDDLPISLLEAPFPFQRFFKSVSRQIREEFNQECTSLMFH